MPNDTPAPTAPSGEVKLPVLRCDRCGDTRALNSIVELGMVHHCPIGGLGAYRLHTERTEAEAEAAREQEFTDNEADRWGWDNEQVEDAVNFARMFKGQRDKAQSEVSRLTSELDRVRGALAEAKNTMEEVMTGAPANSMATRATYKAVCAALGGLSTPDATTRSE